MQLNPYWITGFVDGEGTFYVGVNPQREMTVGYQVLPEFRIVQHEKSVQVLYAIKKFFRCGVVRTNHADRKEYRVRDIKQLQSIIIPFFEMHPLQTAKKIDYIKFRRIIDAIGRQKHLTKEGLIEIIDIASQMNRVNKLKALDIKRRLLE